MKENSTIDVFLIFHKTFEKILSPHNKIFENKQTINTWSENKDSNLKIFSLL